MIKIKVCATVTEFEKATKVSEKYIKRVAVDSSLQKDFYIEDKADEIRRSYGFR